MDPRKVYLVVPDGIRKKQSPFQKILPASTEVKDAFVDRLSTELSGKRIPVLLVDDNEKKRLAFYTTITSLEPKDTMVLPLDNRVADESAIDTQFDSFRQILRDKPKSISKIILALPPDATVTLKRKALDFARETGQIEAQNVVWSTEELVQQIEGHSRLEILKKHIQTQVIKALSEEHKRLKDKYDIAYEVRSKVHNLGHKASKDAEGNAGNRSNETEKDRINAKERCEAIQKTISQLEEHLETLNSNSVSNENLNDTLDSLKKIIKNNIEEFDKRKGIAGGFNKFGRALLNIMITATIILPPAMGLIKWKATHSDENSKWTKFGKKMGLTDRGLWGMWFSLEGKTSLEGSRARSSVDDVRGEIINEEKKKPAPRNS